MDAEKLIDEIQKSTKDLIIKAENLKKFSDLQLHWKSNPNSWSILECLEHLNLYSQFYNPEIRNALKNTNSKWQNDFHPGILGDYFAKSMLPKEKLNTMKTSTNKNPANVQLDRSVIDHFISDQTEFLNLLEQSKGVNLNRVKIKISISKWVKLKLGDTFRFINNHNFRHFQQIEKIEKKLAQSHCHLAKK